MSEYRMTDPDAIRTFLYSGRAVFTIRSAASDNHWTFRVTCKRAGDPYFVSLLCGGHDYHYLGYITDRAGTIEFGYRTSNKSCRPNHDTTHSVIRFLLNSLRIGKLHSQFEFFHEGKCGKCGKPLTDPKSIERGLGPTCATRV